MRPQDEARDSLPDESAPLEELAEFWDTHDTADYEDAFTTVDATFDLRHRHFEVEIKEDLFNALRQRAARLQVTVEEMLDDLLRNDLLSSASG